VPLLFDELDIGNVCVSAHAVVAPAGRRSQFHSCGCSAERACGRKCCDGGKHFMGRKPGSREYRQRLRLHVKMGQSRFSAGTCFTKSARLSLGEMDVPAVMIYQAKVAAFTGRQYQNSGIEAD
jgi:hypothetical protein